MRLPKEQRQERRYKQQSSTFSVCGSSAISRAYQKWICIQTIHVLFRGCVAGTTCLKGLDSGKINDTDNRPCQPHPTTDKGEELQPSIPSFLS